MSSRQMFHCIPCGFRTASTSAWASHVSATHPQLDATQTARINHYDLKGLAAVAHTCPLCGVELTGAVVNIVAHIDRKHPYEEVAPPYPDFVVDEVILRFERELAFEAYCQERAA